MKVRIIGAGPAGLYLAILLKKADRDHDVAIIERNPPDATFGWGVVFSEETLGALRDADTETHLEITDTFARWPAIDIHYRGRKMRSRGHAFSAIPRKLLLQILAGEDTKYGYSYPGKDLRSRGGDGAFVVVDYIEGTSNLEWKWRPEVTWEFDVWVANLGDTEAEFEIFKN